MLNYKKDGMPVGYGLGENNILFRKHNAPEIKKSWQIGGRSWLKSLNEIN